MARRKKEGGRWRSHRVRWGGAEQEEGRKSAAKPRRRSCRFGIAQIAGRPGLRGVENSAARYFAPASAKKRGPESKLNPGPRFSVGLREGGRVVADQNRRVSGRVKPVRLRCNAATELEIGCPDLLCKCEGILSAMHPMHGVYPRFRQRPSYHPQASPKAFGVISRIRKSLSAATRTDPFNSDA